MPDLFQALDRVSAPSSRKTRPKKAIAGKRRKMAQHLRNYLTIVRKQDTNESLRGSAFGYTPCLVLGGLNSATDKAWLKVLQAVEAALATTAN